MWKRYRLKHVLQTLGFTAITIPLFQKVEKTPAGNFSIIIRMGLGSSPTKFLKRIDQVAVGMKMEEAELFRVSRNKFKLTFRNRSQEVFPSYPKSEAPPENPQLINDIPFGKNADGYQVRLPIFTPSGGTVSLIGGLQGQGKSSALKLLVSGFANTNDCILWFDAKSGADASAYSQRVNVYTDPANPEMYLNILKRLYTSCLIRNRLVSHGASLASLPRIILLIDEWFLLSALGEKNIQNEIQSELRKIVAIGRSANISVILATQRPTSQNIDVTTRELCNTRVAFYCGDIHASEAILGQSGAEDKTNPLRPGEALIWINGRLERTTLFEVPELSGNLWTSVTTQKMTLDEVQNQEKKLCRLNDIPSE